jgi:hypothetical protein
MDTVQEYRRYAAASLAMAKDANCPIERTRLLLLAKGWIDLADGHPYQRCARPAAWLVMAPNVGGVAAALASIRRQRFDRSQRHIKLAQYAARREAYLRPAV